MRGTALFNHAELAPVRAMLERSPTARGVLDSVDGLSTKLTVEPWPKDGTSYEKVMEYGNMATYHPFANRVTLPQSWLTSESHTVATTLKGEPVQVRIDGQLDIESATGVLHEARHRQQAGRFPRLRTMGGFLVGEELVRGVVSGVRELRGAHPAADRGPVRRFVDGFDRSSMRTEADAYVIQSKAARELGADTSADDWPDTADQAFRYLQQFPEYRQQIVLRRVANVALPVAVGAAVPGAVEDIREQI